MKSAVLRYVSEGSDQRTYTHKIEGFVAESLPQVAVTTGKSWLEAMTNAFVSTKQHRLGAWPSPEAVVRMREVFRVYEEWETAIPVLIPWAAVKARPGEMITNSLDLGEVMALHMLACLNDRIKIHHEPGIRFIFRMEDLTEIVISTTETQPSSLVEQLTIQYIKDFKFLVKHTLEKAEVLPESSFTKPETFVPIANTISESFHNLIEYKDYDALLHLRNLGWQGDVPMELLTFLQDRFSPEGVAKYLAAILTRRVLKATGRDYAEKMLELSFTPPLPGSPEDIPRVYYRTVPRAFSNFHIAPWAAHGHLRVSENHEEGEKLRVSLHYQEGDKKFDGSTYIEDPGGRDNIHVCTPIVFE